MERLLPRWLGLPAGRLDRWAIGLSGLCVVHCVTTAVLMGLMASAGGALLSPVFHEAGLALAIGFGILALGQGMLTHGYALPVAVASLGLGVMAGALSLPHGDGEVIWTLVGVGLLALGHDLNRRALL